MDRRNFLLVSGAVLGLAGCQKKTVGFDDSQCNSNSVSHGEFTPLAGSGSPFQQVHFFPKNGNKILIDGKLETIPSGIGVISGGVIGTYNNASIEKKLRGTLAPKTLYYVYVYMLNGVMTMDFSTGGHRADLIHGNEVHEADPTRSLVGMVYTGALGKFVGEASKQLTISWFNMGHTALNGVLDGYQTSSKALIEVEGAPRLEWLQWGINNTFKQGFTVPNIYIAGAVTNSIPGNYVEVSIGLDGGGCCGTHKSSHFQSAENDRGTIFVALTGAAGTNEGHHYATFLMGTGGSNGIAKMVSGIFYSSPLFS